MPLLFLNIGTQEFLIIIPIAIFFLYTLFHAITNPRLNSSQRILWIILILFTSLIGWLAYWLIGRKGSEK